MIIVGSGDHSHIKSFRETTGFSGKILTDPSRNSFQMLGLSSGIGGLFGLTTLAKGFSALRKGIKPGSIQGSALQLGGALVVDQQGSIRYHHQSKEAGDDPPVEEMLMVAGE